MALNLMLSAQHTRAPVLIGNPTPAVPPSASTAEHVRLPAAPEAPPHGAKKRIYAAGKMMFYIHPKRDWRGLRSRKEVEHPCSHPVTQKLQEFRSLEVELGPSWIYVGPYFLRCPNHEHELDWFHNLDDCPDIRTIPPDQREFSMQERDRQLILDTMVEQIARCDVLYARVGREGDSSSVWTEVGCALAQGKRVYVDLEADTHDQWLARHMMQRSGATREEYRSIPWALYK